MKAGNDARLTVCAIAVWMASVAVAAPVEPDWCRLRDGAPNICAGLTGVEGWPCLAFWGGPALEDWEYPGKIYKPISKYRGIAQGTYTEIRKTVPGGSRFAQFWAANGRCVFGNAMSCMGAVFDFTAEDAADPLASARQTEAIVRQCHAVRPYYEILFVCGATPELVRPYLDGREPEYARQLERVAEHYRLPSVNLAKFAADEIRAGRATWEDFAGAKPTARANACVTEAVRIFFDLIFVQCGTMPRKYVDRTLPAPLFKDMHAEGRIVPYDGGFASFGQDWLGWQRPIVQPFPHLLVSTAPQATLTFPFRGTEVGLVDEIHPDSPALEYAIDGGEFRTLPAPFAKTNELRHAFLASGLPNTDHTLTLRVKGAGTERLGAFLLNGMAKDPSEGLDYLGKLDRLAMEMPKVDYMPPAGRFAYLPKTVKKLREGGTLKMVMLGDSICADTSQSQFEKRLMKRYPKCTIEKVLSVRGSTGCDWYAQENRVQSYVLDHRPDLLIIAGISHQPDPRDVRTVVRQVRAKSPGTEILLVTPVFGRTSCSWNVNWTPDVDRTRTDDWRTILETIAREEKTAYFDMTGPLGAYIRSSKMTPGAFMRDIVHANDRGKYLLGELMCRWFEVER